MLSESIFFSQTRTAFYFDGRYEELLTLIGPRQVVVLTDANVRKAFPDYFKGWPTIVIQPGEDSKNMATVVMIGAELIRLGINREALLVGWGGGVVTDIAGFVAGIYKRGIACAFVPTTVLAMVDAAIGGKNGINSGDYKNMLGLIRQPEFIFYDLQLLSLLPDVEWVNGFAEIIKHACIADREMFGWLEQHALSEIKADRELLARIIRENVLLKTGFVRQDEFESGSRKQLNFGHTLGHAVEKKLQLRHGFAVAIGMAFACRLSECELGFRDTGAVVALLEKYHLPVQADIDIPETTALLEADKKRNGAAIQYVLLSKIGKADIRSLTIPALTKYLETWTSLSGRQR
ncbi:MAG TPA: 3-dehydroquinate synthase family protein [Edaphocola sp.]|nr:3-dehydroquinate synthase family protein [Edaphocola sp.]